MGVWILDTWATRVVRSAVVALGALSLGFTAACSERAHPDTTRVEWFDDFLGSRLHPAYSYVLTQADFAHPVDGIGGWFAITASDPEYNARFRLGDDPRDTFGVQMNMPFAHAQHASGQTRVVMSHDAQVEATIGFVGPDDPNGVGGALLYRNDGTNAGWILQTCRDGECEMVPTGFRHAVGQAFTVEIRLAPGRVEALINGRRVAVSTEHVPTGGAAWEYQIWGMEAPGVARPQPTMLIDFLSISQRR